MEQKDFSHMTREAVVIEQGAIKEMPPGKSVTRPCGYCREALKNGSEKSLYLRLSTQGRKTPVR